MKDTMKLLEEWFRMNCLECGGILTQDKEDGWFDCTLCDACYVLRGGLVNEDDLELNDETKALIDAARRATTAAASDPGRCK